MLTRDCQISDNIGDTITSDTKKTSAITEEEGDKEEMTDEIY